MENPSVSIIDDQDDGRNGAGKKVLKKIGVAVVGALLVPVNATIQTITYPFRFLVDSVKEFVDTLRDPDILVGSKVFGFIFSVLLSPVGLALSLPFALPLYLVGAVIDLVRAVRAAGEQGDENKLDTVDKYKFCNNQHAEKRELTLSAVFQWAIGKKTTVAPVDYQCLRKEVEVVAFGDNPSFRPVLDKAKDAVRLIDVNIDGRIVDKALNTRRDLIL